MVLPKQPNSEHFLMPCSNPGCGLLTALISTAGRERRREGGRKDGRKQETMAGLAPRCCVRLPILHMLLSNSCKLCAIYRFWFQNVVGTVQFLDFSGARSKHHASMCNVQMIVPTCCKYHPTCSFELQQAAK